MIGYLKDFFIKKVPMFRKSEHARHLLYIHPILAMVLFDMRAYCDDAKLPYEITSIIRSPMVNIKVQAKSLSHTQGRAFDLSDNGWSAFEIDRFIEYFNNKYKDIAAISSGTGEPNLVIYHDAGSGFHFHVQIHAKYAIKDAWANL